MVPLVPEGKNERAAKSHDFWKSQGPWTHDPGKNEVRSRDHEAMVPAEIEVSDPIWLGLLRHDIKP
jgi:hypothetical protein